MSQCIWFRSVWVKECRFVPVIEHPTMKIYAKVEVQFHVFVTSALEGGEL